MFNNPRYATRGISAEVPLLTQIILWSLVDSMEVSDKDYLQVFKLTASGNIQSVAHTQETPEYSNTISFATEKAVTAKIFVIDDGDHSTMLLAEEY